MGRLERLRSLGPEYSEVHMGGTPDSLATKVELRRLQAVLKGKIFIVHMREDDARPWDWH